MSIYFVSEFRMVFIVIDLITLAISIVAAFALRVPPSTETSRGLPRLPQIESFEIEQTTRSHD